MTSKSPPALGTSYSRCSAASKNWVALASRPEVTTESQSRCLAVKACSWADARVPCDRLPLCS